MGKKFILKIIRGVFQPEAPACTSRDLTWSEKKWTGKDKKFVKGFSFEIF